MAGASSDISSWVAGAVTETWREPKNCDGADQASKSAVFVASSDGRLSSDKYRYAAYVLRSDARIRNIRQKREAGLLSSTGKS